MYEIFTQYGPGPILLFCGSSSLSCKVSVLSSEPHRSCILCKKFPIETQMTIVDDLICVWQKRKKTTDRCRIY